MPDKSEIISEYAEVMEGYKRHVMVRIEGGEWMRMHLVRTREGELGVISENLMWLLVNNDLAKFVDGKGIMDA